MIKNNYGMRTNLNLPFAETIETVTLALKSEGFGIITEINVQETLKEKLNISFRRYMILGACNPPLANQALQNELEIGLLMPCNVIVYELDGGETAVAIADPHAMLTLANTHALQEMADLAKAKLIRVLDALSQPAILE